MATTSEAAAAAPAPTAGSKTVIKTAEAVDRRGARRPARRLIRAERATPPNQKSTAVRPAVRGDAGGTGFSPRRRHGTKARPRAVSQGRGDVAATSRPDGGPTPGPRGSVEARAEREPFRGSALSVGDQWPASRRSRRRRVGRGGDARVAAASRRSRRRRAAAADPRRSQVGVMKTFEDGSKIQSNLNGTTIEISPDGTRVQTNSDGTIITSVVPRGLSSEDGSRRRRGRDVDIPRRGSVATSAAAQVEARRLQAPGEPGREEDRDDGRRRADPDE